MPVSTACRLRWRIFNQSEIYPENQLHTMRSGAASTSVRGGRPDTVRHPAVLCKTRLTGVRRVVPGHRPEQREGGEQGAREPEREVHQTACSDHAAREDRHRPSVTVHALAHRRQACRQPCPHRGVSGSSACGASHVIATSAAQPGGARGNERAAVRRDALLRRAERAKAAWRAVLRTAARARGCTVACGAGVGAPGRC